MFKQKSLQIALIFSFIVHGAVIINYPALNFLSLPNKPAMVKISYLKNPPQLTRQQKELLYKRAALMELPSQVKAFEKKELALPPVKDNILTRSRPAFARQQIAVKPSVIRPDIIAVKKKITLPPVDIEKLNNPSYVSYYQFVREKIRHAAYQNYGRSETGEVYLAFVISSDGVLKDVRLIEEKSSGNYYLRETALRSIRDSSPFSPFPKELDYPQLSFNVIISFEVE